MDSEQQQQSLFCRICCLQQEEPPWGEDGQSPSYDICPCCGAEFGYEDCQLNAIQAYRTEWLKNSDTWFQPKKKPDNWSLKKQLNNIKPLE
jgi:hypothetical protein